MSRENLLRLVKRTATAMLGIVVAGCTKSSGPAIVQLPPPAVTVAKPIVREVTDSDEFEGRIEAIGKVELRARVSGYVTKVTFENGQHVKANDLLYEIDARPYEAILRAAEAKKIAAEATLKLANIEFNRTKELVEKSAAPRAELDLWTGKLGVAQADLLIAEADIEKAQLDVQFTTIKAPIDGKISRNNVTPGNLVSGSGDVLLATLVSTSPLYARFDVDERRLLSYRRSAIDKNAPARNSSSLREAKIPVQVGLDGEVGFPHKGILDSADNTVRSSTGTISVLAIIQNESGILDDGLRARVRLPIGNPYQATLVTDRAIGSEQGIRFVYVVDEKNRVERREVTLGRMIGNLQIVTSNLKPTDRVIVNGIQRVREGIEVVPKEVAMPGDTAVPTSDAAEAQVTPPQPTNGTGDKR